ncbi:SGNH/GDSL hydrolase family protein [Kocuria sp. CPCC 205300]|uniref:SGNH/GDSL hydrolase family protein n=1 Tax=Kocuria sabuli TaxID=3071448 RepID=UPI0036DB9AD5
MQRTPRPASARSKKKQETPKSKKLANAAIIGLSALLVAGLGAAFVQDEQAQARNAESVSSYTPPAVDEADVEIIRFAAVGDSITEANSPDIVERRVGNASWVSYAESKSTRYAGGWADGGAQTKAMRENFEAVSNADVLVVLAGANDVANDVPFDETTSNISAIVDEAGTERVIVSSIPPQSKDPARVVEFNDRLEDFARDNGWEWVDASAELRDGDDFADGMSEDGVHPTQKGAKVLGDVLQEAIAGK